MKSAMLVWLLICWLFPHPGQSQPREEFNGPFASWANVRLRFGAKGDGKTDDTRALQKGIDSLSNMLTGFNTGKDAYAVLYLPAGTYCISSSLVLKGKIGVSILGEDPARTIIKWTGPDHDTLLWANGSAYYKIARFTFDAGHGKGMEGIGIHWKDRWNDGKTQSYASVCIEIADCVFSGGFAYGIFGGTTGGNGTGWNDSEVTIRRCSFSGCSIAGIGIQGYNALDYWIWDCRFLQCNTGIDCLFGNYHVYRSLFSGSRAADVHNTNGYYLSVRGCYSDHSSAFSLDAGMSSNPFKRIFQDNTIIRPLKLPVEYYHLGKITLWGNRFTAAVDTTWRLSVNTQSWAPGIYEVLSLHNIYPFNKAIRIGSGPSRIYSYGDEVAPSVDWAATRKALQEFVRTLSPTPPHMKRKVLEVPRGADGNTVQAILNKAAALKGQRPVVHFPLGVYSIGSPLEIPAGSDMSLTGDGRIYSTVLRPAGNGDFRHDPLLRIKGPTFVVIQDLQIDAGGPAGPRSGISIEGADQPGSQAHLDQVYSQADTSLFADSLNDLYIEKDNSFFGAGNVLVGGRLMQEGKGKARVSCNGGQFAGLSVKGNAVFLARDCWWEGSTRVPLDLSGAGRISIDGAMIAPGGADSLPTIRIGSFSGTISLMNMYVQGALWCEPANPALDLLVWNIHFYHKMNVLDFLGGNPRYRGAFLGLNAQCFLPNDPACKQIISIPDRTVNVQDPNLFLDSATRADREDRPVPFTELPAGISNIYISRVAIGKMNRGIVFQ